MVKTENAIVDVAIQTGENNAAIETLEKTTEEITQQQENLENRLRWNDDSLDRAFERIWALEARIEALEAVEIAEVVEEIETKNPTEETTIEEPTNVQPAKKKKRTAIGLW